MLDTGHNAVVGVALHRASKIAEIVGEVREVISVSSMHRDTLNFLSYSICTYTV